MTLKKTTLKFGPNVPGELVNGVLDMNSRINAIIDAVHGMDSKEVVSMLVGLAAVEARHLQWPEGQFSELAARHFTFPYGENEVPGPEDPVS